MNKTESYNYDYPIKIFSKTRPNFFRPFLTSPENPYFLGITKQRLKVIKGRIKIVKNNIPWIKKLVNKITKDRKIVSIFIYGSFIFSPNDYKSSDIDIGIVVAGSFFRYEKITNIPAALKKYNIKTIDIFIYGRDNLEKGVKINDVIKGGIIHRDVIKHESSIAYWRNVVIYGQSFNKFPNLLYNTYIFLKVNLNNIQERLKRYGHYNKESDEYCLSKVSNRLYEMNIFLNIFAIEPHYSQLEINSWPVLGRQRKMTFNQLDLIYKNTINKLKELKYE
jgi:predicted nucleotidyltransferase